MRTPRFSAPARHAGEDGGGSGWGVRSPSLAALTPSLSTWAPTGPPPPEPHPGRLGAPAAEQGQLTSGGDRNGEILGAGCRGLHFPQCPGSHFRCRGWRGSGGALAGLWLLLVAGPGSSG